MSIGTLSRRSVTLIVALLLAAFATATWVSYVRSIERRAVQSTANVGIYVAAETIPAGMKAEDADARKLFVKTPVPRRLAAEGAVTTLPALRGTVAGVTILKGEQIVRARFVEPAQAARLLQIPADRQAMTVEVATPPGVGGFLQPHDHVSIIAKVAPPNAEPVVRFLMQDIAVLAVGSRTAPSAPPSGAREAARDAAQEQPALDRAMLTLAVTPWEAEQLALAVLEGEVYFTLLPQGQKPQTTPGRTAGSLFR